jgi:DNA-binding XRE family transcriptional regulator
MTPAEFREARAKLGLTQAQLAEWLGYTSGNAIAQIEGGRKGITPMLTILMQMYLDGHKPPHIRNGTIEAETDGK